MKVHLLYRDRDFDEGAPLPANAPALMQDLELETLLSTMAQGDRLLYLVAKQAVLAGLRDDLDTVLHRQAVLRDCLEHEPVVRTLYDLAVDAIEARRTGWYGIFGHYPSSILHGAVELLQMLASRLGQLQRLADAQAGRFASEGFRTLFATVRAELDDDYLARIRAHLGELRFRDGVLISAGLGPGNQGVRHVLRRSKEAKPGWLRRLFARRPAAFTFQVDPRDESGARALAELRDRGLNHVANAVAQSADHVLDFFIRLRLELAFYLGAVNLHKVLAARGVSLCFPEPAPAGSGRCGGTGLRDACLALTLPGQVVGNDLAADGRRAVVVTGANRGGKSTFLRSVGLAQLMMQSGLFVAADSFRSDLCAGLFTHYRREEDASMRSGKFDEELGRMSGLVGALAPGALVLLNESLAATNDREGSEVARQIVLALLEAGVRIFYVTHLVEFSHRLWQEAGADGALFLRAERQPDGRRTFRILPGEPLHTSFGADLYRTIFTERAAGALSPPC